nr:hypothetical protein [Tanacetum cinerariifolium]
MSVEYEHVAMNLVSLLELGEDTSQPPQPLASLEVPQMVSSVKLPILKKGEYILWTMKMEQYLAHTNYDLWEVILNGNNAIQKTKDEANNKIEVHPVTVQRILARTRERKAKITLLMAIPYEHLARFHRIKDAKTLWAAIKTRFGDNAEFKKISLPLVWSNISLIMRNKSGIDNLDIDDLYNNLKVYEADIKISYGSSSNSQNAIVLKHKLDNKDLEQIDQDDLERWTLNGRDCKSARNSENRSKDVGNTRYIGRDNGKRPTKEEDENALVVHDGLGTYDWSYQVEEEATNFALIAFTSNPSSSLSSNYELDEALKEKEDLKAKLKKFETSLKNLTKLLSSQISAKVKTSLGYDSQFHEKEVFDIRKEEVTKTVFDNRSSDEENSLANDRFKKCERYHAVPPPLTGKYMPPKPDLSFARLDESIYKFKISKTVTSLAKHDKDAPETSTASVKKPKEDRSSSLLIQYWETDSDNDSVFRHEPIPAKIDFVKAVFTRSSRIPVSAAKPKAAASTSATKPVNTVGPGHPQQALKNKEIVDSDCSRHMTGNKAYLTEYHEINDVGFVAFGSSRGRISGKGIKREYSNAKTLQQNGVAERMNITLIEATKTMLTFVSLTIYASYIEQFWNTVTSKTINSVKQIHAIVDGKAVVILESSVKSDILFNDEDVEDFVKRLRSTLGEEGMVRNVDSPNKILMYPRFLQVAINNQVDDLTSHNTRYISPALTQKVFANMIMVRKGFSRVETPLFALMLVQPQPHAEEEKEEDDEMPIAPSPPLQDPTPTPYATPPQDQPSIPPASPPQEQPTTTFESYVNAASKGVSAAEPTIFDDEEVTMTMAQTLIKLKAEKAKLLDEHMAQKLHDKEVQKAAARDKQEKDDLERAQVQERHLDNIRKYQSLKKKPISIAQARKNMIIYLKNMAGYKMKHFYDKESFKKLRAAEVSGSESIQEIPSNDPKEIRKFYTNCGVHQVSSTTRRHDMFMLTEKDYPLSNAVMILMLSAKLHVEEDNKIARDLVMKIFMEANKPKSRKFRFCIDSKSFNKVSVIVVLDLSKVANPLFSLRDKDLFKQILLSPSTYQRKHKKTHKHRNAKKVTKLPQTSVPLDHGADETQSTTMSNDPISHEIGSGDTPRCQETILVDTDAQTRFQTTSKQSYDLPLSEVNTSGSGEDSMEHQDDLMDVVPPTPYDSPLSAGFLS